MRLPILVECGQVYLLSNHISGIFNGQYLRKESIDNLGLSHEDNHQRNEESETTTLGWMGSGVLLVQSD